MKYVEALNEDEIDVFTRSLGLLSSTRSQSQKETDAPIRVMSNNVTALTNAFEMIRTYASNILSINKAVIESERRNTRENTVESFYTQPRNDSLAANISNRYPQLIQSIEQLAARLQDVDLASKKSILEGLAGGMGSLLAGVGAVGAAGYAAYELFDDEEPETIDTPNVKTKPSDEKYQPPKSTSSSEQKANEYERAIKDQVAPEKKQNIITSVFVAEKMKNSVLSPLAIGAGMGALFSIGGGYERFIQGYEDGYSGIQGAGSSENAEIAMNYFMQQGWTREQAAGIVGNLQAESGKNLNPAAFNKAGGGMGARGIAQWRGPRIVQFQKLYGTTPDRAPLHKQLEYVQWELNNTERDAGRSLRTASTAEQAAAIFENKYERAGHAIDKRIANARALAGGSSYAVGSDIGQIADTGALVTRQALDQVQDASIQVPANYRQYIRTLGNVNLNGMHPTVMRRFAAMAMEYYQKTGDKLQVNSAFRTRAEQAALYAKLGPGKAARPGRSRHESGLAIDIQSAQANKLENLGLMGKYKFHRPLGHEKWHLEPIEGRNVPRSASIEENAGSDSQAAAATREASSKARTQVASLSENRAITQRRDLKETEKLLTSRGAGIGVIAYTPPSPRQTVTSRKPQPKLPSQSSSELLRRYLTK